MVPLQESCVCDRGHKDLLTLTGAPFLVVLTH
jgi:hypothetical protein